MSLVSITDNLIGGLKPITTVVGAVVDKVKTTAEKIQEEVAEALTGNTSEDKTDKFEKSETAEVKTETRTEVRTANHEASAEKVDQEIKANEKEATEVKAEQKENKAEMNLVDAAAKENAAETAEVKSELQQTNADLQEASATVVTAKADLSDSKTALQTAKANEQQANAALQTLTSGSEEGENLVEIAQARSAAAAAAQETANAEESVEQAQEQVAKAEAEKEDLEDKKDDLTEDKAELEAEKAEIDGEKADLTEEKGELAEDAEELKEEKAELEAEKAEIEKEAEEKEEAEETEKTPSAETTTEPSTSEPVKENCSAPAVTPDIASSEDVEIGEDDFEGSGKPSSQKPEQPVAPQTPVKTETPETPVAEDKTPVEEDKAPAAEDKTPAAPAVQNPVFEQPEIPVYEPVQPCYPQDDYYYYDAIQIIEGGYALSIDAAEVLINEVYAAPIAVSIDDITGMDAQSAIQSLEESVKAETFSKVVYKNNISASTDSASVEENKKAVAEFITAFNEASDKVNAPNVEFLSLTDKSNYDTAQVLISRLNEGEYILTKEIESATQEVKSVEVSAIEEEDKEEKKFDTQGANILRQLQTKITDDQDVVEDKNDDILTKAEYEDLENFFEKADDKSTAYDKLVEEARKYSVYSATTAA